jgi:WD40 repeat protein
VISDTNVVQIWDMSAGSLAGEMAVDLAFPLHVAFSPSGRFLTVGYIGGLVRVIDMEALAETTALEEAIIFDRVVHTGNVPRPSITNEGILATAGFDGLVRLWDVHSGELLVELGPGAGPVVGFVWDGSYLLYSNYTKTVLRRFYLDPERLIDLAHQMLTRERTVDECRQYLLDSPSCPAT